MMLPNDGGLDELLALIPVTSKSDLARQLAADESWLEAAVLFSETSGTTGRPLPTPRGVQDLAWNAANQAAAYMRFLRPGIDRVAIVHPSVLSPFVEASALALRDSNVGYLRVYPIPGVCDYSRIFEALTRYRITALMTTPSLASKLLYEFLAFEGGGAPPSLKKLLLTGEELSLSRIENFKRILGSEAVVVPFVYGSSEAATLMLGRQDGLFDPLLDDFILEFASSDVREGGRLIVTWLRGGVMPILRYDTEDFFHVAQTSPPVLQYLGRDGPTDATRRLWDSIEQTVHSSGQAIFHFEAKLVDVSKRLAVSAVVLPSVSAGFKFILEDRLRALLPSWQVDVDINPPSVDFLKFSPRPKNSRFSS